MLYKVPYTDLLGRQKALNDNADKRLIEEWNIITEDFLVFDDFVVSADKLAIVANGIDEVTITVSVVTEAVIFSVNDVEQTSVTPIDGRASFRFATNAIGTFDIGASTSSHNKISVIIQGV